MRATARMMALMISIGLSPLASAAVSAESTVDAAQIATLCANCHGANGNSPNPDTPNLAGQNPRYLLAQMQKFASGERRFEFMEGMIKAMSPKEREAVAQYFAQQTVPPRAPADPALAARGKDIFSKICFRCHGADGRGTEQYARLAGQQTGYVERTLRRYRDPRNTTRKNPLMADATAMLTDNDIRAVAAYAASMP